MPMKTDNLLFCPESQLLQKKLNQIIKIVSVSH